MTFCKLIPLRISISLLVSGLMANQLKAQEFEEDAGFNEPLADDLVDSTSVVNELSDVEVIDLNEINLREAQESWESVQQPRGTDVTDSVRIEEIIEPPTDYRYSAFGKPDPFKRPSLELTGNVSPAALTTGVDEVTASEIPMVSPLQAYPLEELEVKGVWVLRGGETRAIVMTPKKEGIVVKVGDPIAAGKVLSINRQSLIVRQYRIREDGVREFEDLELAIGNQQEKRRGIIKLSPGKDPEFVKFDDEGPRPATQQNQNQVETPAQQNPVPGEALRPVNANQ